MSSDALTITCTDVFTWKEKSVSSSRILSTRLAIFWFKSCFHFSIFLPFDMFICRKRSCRCNSRKKGSIKGFSSKEQCQGKRGNYGFDSRFFVFREVEVLCFVEGLVLGVITSTATVISAVRESNENRKEVEERKRHRWVIGCVHVGHRRHSLKWVCQWCKVSHRCWLFVQKKPKSRVTTLRVWVGHHPHLD